ncbi:CiaD-like domain-containing protein [Helicobacter acinonychis]|uniref:Campylobacter invasion antigen D C-terminal domain-containing protein n=1 Tax=Helicobacter acinonychis (strain Sheeba) TaxID=382638 RepID=Q17YT9_HELAH|nr:hypothetical protein [Helicobacter acinonychis]CAJ99187.1 conserved hypothetical protein [Helicobacter acinonychis str. Sheeba]
MELKNIISETLNEIEKMAKTIDDFDVTQKTPSFFKTPPYLQNTKNAETPPISNTEPKNTPKIETQEKIVGENHAQEIIIKEITTETPKQVQISSERVFLKNLLERTLVLFKGMQALEEKEAIERLDLVARFLQYQLSVLEKRLESLEEEYTE